MAKNKDVFGFEELEKSFKRLEKRYPSQADAMLMAQGQAVQKRVKALTPVYTGKYLRGGRIKPGQLKKSWRLKKVKLYKGGTVRVVRLQNNANHAHLIEDGHKIYTTGGRKTGKVGRYNRVQQRIRGIKNHGSTEGVHMLEKGMTEARQRFDRDAQKTLDKLIESEGLDI